MYISLRDGSITGTVEHRRADHQPAIPILHLQLVLEGVRRGCLGRPLAPLEPEGLVAESGALQAGGQRGQRLGLQLKGVTKRPRTQAV